MSTVFVMTVTQAQLEKNQTRKEGKNKNNLYEMEMTDQRHTVQVHPADLLYFVVQPHPANMKRLIHAHIYIYIIFNKK